jgi:Tfp pilus assembly protein PilX
MERIQRNDAHRQDGIAILVTTVALLLVAMIGLTSLEHTQEESTSAGRSRNYARTLHAADAGIEFARSRLGQTPPNLTAFDLTLLDGAQVASRQRDQGSAQVLNEVGVGGTTEGYALNSGAASMSNRIYQVNVTGTAGSAVAELEARFAVAEPGSTSY